MHSDVTKARLLVVKALVTGRFWGLFCVVFLLWLVLYL